MQTYGSQGLEALGTPCNQFGGQEPGEGVEVLGCLRCVRPGNNFVPLFPLTFNLDVMGALQDATWKDVTNICPAPWSSDNKTVAWNFETILFDRKGFPYRRYATPVDPRDMADDVAYLLSQ